MRFITDAYKDAFQFAFQLLQASSYNQVVDNDFNFINAEFKKKGFQRVYLLLESTNNCMKLVTAKKFEVSEHCAALEQMSRTLNKEKMCEFMCLGVTCDPGYIPDILLAL